MLKLTLETMTCWNIYLVLASHLWFSLVHIYCLPTLLRQWHRCLEHKEIDHRLFAFETWSKVSMPLSHSATPAAPWWCSLAISEPWAILFQSLHYYLVADLDMQSKGHAICATLVSQSNGCSMMPRPKTYNCEPGDSWLKFSQHTSKNAFYPHCTITSY